MTLVNPIGALALVLMLSVSAQARVLETPWLARGDAMLVKCVQLDSLRGFHALWLEERAMDPTAANKMTIHRNVPHFKRWARLGELELWQQARQEAQARIALKLSHDGWGAFVPIPVNALGDFKWSGSALRVRVERYENGSRVVISQAKTQRRFKVADHHTSRVDLGQKRTATLSLASIASLAQSPDGRWLTIGVHMAPSIHVHQLPAIKLFTVSRAALEQALLSTPKPVDSI